jgi:hypothetical protein
VSPGAQTASKDVLVGGKVIAIAIPPGMQDIAWRSAAVRKVVESDVPVELKVLAYFVPEASVAMFDAGRATDLDRHVIVVSYLPDEGRDKSAAEFLGFQTTTDESLAKKRGTPQTASVIERGKNHYSYAGVRDRAANESTAEPARKIVAATLAVRVEEQQVSYFIYANYRDDGDLDWAKRLAISLRKAMQPQTQ